MESVRQLLLAYLGVMVINLALAAVLWARYRTDLHRSLFLVWASMILAGMVQAIPAPNDLVLALLFVPTFLIGNSLAGLLARVAGLPLRRMLYLSVLAAGVVVAVAAHAAGASFRLIALPVSIAVALPLFDTPLRALLQHSARLGMTGKAAALSCIAQGLHDLDYPFLRDKPELAALGFSIAFIIIFAISVTAPAVVLERVADERARIDELNRFQRQFFANITHELRTPLTMILAPLEIMLAGDSGSVTRGQRAYLEACWRNAIRLLKAVNDLLDLAKVGEGFLRLRIARTDLRRLLEDVVAYARPLAARKSLDLALEIRSASADLHVDEEKIERVLVNLLSNALKFTDRGAVRIWMESRGGEVRIGVADTGPGIPAGRLASIFERFSQGDDSVTRRYGGTGIGLAFSREIVELHGGTLTVDSVPGQGSTFVVHLREGRDHLRPEVVDRRAVDGAVPVTQRADDREPREWTLRLQQQADYRFFGIEDATERRLGPRAPSDGARPVTRILVVEDNVEIARLLHLQLQQDHAVMVAHDGQRGLEMAVAQIPDLVITDFMMPVKDGLTLIRELRADARTADIPVIMLSARNQVEDRLAVREAGADVYIGKPFSPRELSAAVRGLLQKTGRQVSRVMRAHVEGLEIVSAGLAHEIHNPLSTIKNAHHLVLENIQRIDEALGGAPPAASGGRDRQEAVARARDKIERLVGTAGRGIRRIEAIVDVVRRYAREGYPSEPTDIPLDPAVADVLALVSPRGTDECSVALRLGAGGVAVRCIPEEMHQVVRNLVQNAVDAAGNAGHVEVATRHESGEAVLEVRDDGPGIPPEILPKMFTPFFTTKTGRGMGLGLAIVEHVVSRADGKVAVESVPGRTTFVVRLPARPAAADAHAASVTDR